MMFVRSDSPMAVMSRVKLIVASFVWLTISGVVAAENPGQADFDKATMTKLHARSIPDLEEAIDLGKSALQKGLAEESAAFAKKIIASAYFQLAEIRSRPILNRRRPARNWERLRSEALEFAKQATDFYPEGGMIHLLAARLQALPGGDLAKARESATKAVENLRDHPADASEAYVVLAALEEDKEKQKEYFDEAIKANPENENAFRGRAQYHMKNRNPKLAIEDFSRLLELQPTDVVAVQAITSLLLLDKKVEEAIEYADKAIQANSRSGSVYVLKAQLLEMQEKKKEAVEVLQNASNQMPRDANVRYHLGRIRVALGDTDLALSDLRRVIRLNPNFLEAYLLKSAVLASNQQFGLAARDLKTVIDRIPDTENTRDRLAELRLQLSMFYVSDKRPSKAVDVLTEILNHDSENVQAFRSRGDAYLNLGRHSDAIADYESAIQFNEKDSGSLNNLAWVLATSPNDEIRDGKRSVELAQKACELTEFKAAHILSTLAAGYAELGKFEEAIKWSTKAVALDADEVQLSNELKSYKEGKPWRELDNVEAATAANEKDLDLVDDREVD